MTALQLFEEAARRGLTLKPAGSDRLAVIPARLCPPEFADILREHKPELLSLISGNPNNLPKVVKPRRPLSERERVILAEVEAENDPLILEALRTFNATVAGIEPSDNFTYTNFNGHGLTLQEAPFPDTHT